MTFNQTSTTNNPNYSFNVKQDFKKDTSDNFEYDLKSDKKISNQIKKHIFKNDDDSISETSEADKSSKKESSHLESFTNGTKRKIVYDSQPLLKKIKTEKTNALSIPPNESERPFLQSRVIEDLSINEKLLCEIYQCLEENYDCEKANCLIQRYIENNGANNFLNAIIKALSFFEISYQLLTPEDKIPFQSLKAFCLFYGLSPAGLDLIPEDLKMDQFMSAKILACIIDQKGSFQVEGETYPYEGMVGRFCFNHKLSNGLKQFRNSLDLSNEKQFELEEAFNFISKAIPPLEFVKRIHEGKLCIAPSGYCSHSLLIVFFKNLMVICDSNSPMLNSKCKPLLISNQNISESDILELLTLKFNYSDGLSANEYIYKKLPGKLVHNELDETKKLNLKKLDKELNYYMDELNFKSNTCYYQSFICALFVSLIILSNEDDDLLLNSNMGQLALDGFLGTRKFIKLTLANVLEKCRNYNMNNNDFLFVKARKLLESYTSEDNSSSEGENEDDQRTMQPAENDK